MTGKVIVGDSTGKARWANKIFIGDSNGKAKEVQAIYVGDSNGIARKVWPLSPLPAAYQQVEYIYNSTGAPYINTEITANNYTRVLIDFQCKSHEISSFYSNMIPFGICNIYYRSSSTYHEGSNFGLEYTFLSSSGQASTRNRFTIMFGDYSNSYELNTSDENTMQRHVLDINRSGGSIYWDDTYLTTIQTTFASRGNPFILFGYSSKYYLNEDETINGTGGVFKYYLYHFTAWQNDVVVRDMYPCYRKSDFKVGMIDIINNNKFYTNPSGTDDFYKGPNV